MKINKHKLALLCSCLFFAGVVFAQTKVDTTKVKLLLAVPTDSKEVTTRNVSDNATTLSSPRDLNIGLPGSNGGIWLVENNLPVPYYYWPFMPYYVWRQDGSFSKGGLMNLAGANSILGRVGYAVTSFDRFGTDVTHGSASILTNDYGLLRLVGSAAGPISKSKGWYYTVSAHLNLDPSTINPAFVKDIDNTQIVKLGLTKRWNKGEISILYKYARSMELIANYDPFYYHTNGSVSAIPGFRFGRDSYLPRDGYIRTYNMMTGALQNTNLKNDTYNQSNTIDIVGKNQLGSGWNLDYTLRYMDAPGTWLPIVQPAGTLATSAFTSLNYVDNNGNTSGSALAAGTPSSKLGQVQMMMSLMDRSKSVQNEMAVFDLSKKFTNSSIHFGIDEFYDKVNKYYGSSSMWLQEIAPNPSKIVGVGAVNTDNYGYFSNNASSEYHDGTENKLAFYFTDDWNISKRLEVNLMARIESHVMNGDYFLDVQDANQNRNWLYKTAAGIANNYSYAGQPTTAFHDGFFHKSGSINIVYKVSKPFGLTGDIIYSEKHGQLENYSGAGDGNPKANASSVTLFAQGGIYYNYSNYFSLVSQLTYANRTNVAFNRTSITNPATGESEVYIQNYGISTLGWTTDIVGNPFKNFNYHVLLTLQNPKYENYAFDITWNKPTTTTAHYDFSGKYATALSHTLIEIEPSYMIQKFRLWARARYFGKQYANVSDALIYQGRWETFGGVDYNLSKKAKITLSVINPINQKGVQGAISNSDLITNGAPYEGKILGAQYIIPFTVQAGFAFNF